MYAQVVLDDGVLLYDDGDEVFLAVIGTSLDKGSDCDL